MTKEEKMKQKTFVFDGKKETLREVRAKLEPYEEVLRFKYNPVDEQLVVEVK